MQVYDEKTTGMHWQRQKVAAEHYRELLRRGAAQENPHISQNRGDVGHPSNV
jgi:4-hydroxy-3-polyprenylbenzoate decarboxylase